MTPAERLRRLLKPIPRPGPFIDFALASDTAKRMISTQIRADAAGWKLAAILGQPAARPLHPTWEDEIHRREDLFRRYYHERDVTPLPDWSPRAAAIESVTDDIQTGRFPL